MRWRVALAGDPFDLEELRAHVTSPHMRVVREGETYFIESAAFEALSTSDDVFQEAQGHLPLINAAARLDRPSYMDATLSGAIIETTAEGAKHHAHVVTDTIRLRSKVDAVIVSTGEQPPRPPPPPPPPPPGSTAADKWLALAARDPDAAKALSFWAKPHDWATLYKVWEIIRDGEEVQNKGWASGNEITRFTRTANHQEAAGDDARHSRLKADPPPNPMTLGEADGFIGRLLRTWLDSMLDPSPP
jgi:hypothetical protein